MIFRSPKVAEAVAPFFIISANTKLPADGYNFTDVFQQGSDYIPLSNPTIEMSCSNVFTCILWDANSDLEDPSQTTSHLVA